MKSEEGDALEMFKVAARNYFDDQAEMIRLRNECDSAAAAAGEATLKFETTAKLYRAATFALATQLLHEGENADGES